MALPKTGGATTSRTGAVKFQRQRKGANLSRKQIFEAQRKVWEVKQKKVDEAKREVKRAKVEQLQKTQNKKAKKVFDRATLQAVQEGLTSAIETLGEKVSPISMFMGAFTALSKSPEKHQTPYMLAILTGCIPQLSQGFLLHQFGSLCALCEQLMAENATTNHLIVVKAMKAVQMALLCVESPSMDIVKQFEKLEPSKLQVEAMTMYLVTFRKMLEDAALCTSDPSMAAPVKNLETGTYTLNAKQQFFIQAVPHFVTTCVNNFTDSPTTIVSASVAELSALFSRTFSPYIVESREGRQMIDSLISHQLLSMLKPIFQSYWGIAVELIETLFNRLNYLKRVQGSKLLFTERFQSVAFLLKVLNKLRGMDDVQLNSKVERAMVAIARGMTMKEFVDIFPFDPRRAFECEMSGDNHTAQQLWSLSYTLNIIRRASSHDSLPFLVEHFFPTVQYASKAAVEAERAQRHTEFTRWSALLVQYWRVAAGFCHYPTEVTNNSFRDLAKQLIGLLSNPSFVDTSATAIHVLCDGYYQLSQQEQQDDDDDEDVQEKLEDDLREQQQPGKKFLRRNRFKDALEEDNVYLSMNDPEWNPHRYHNISQTYAKEICETVFAKYSANIMPKLCNTFETHDSTAVLLAIQSFSKVCSVQVMSTILQGILEVGSSIADQAQARAEQSEEGGATRSKAGSAPLTAKRRMVLDIACAVVSQLPPEHVTMLFNDVIEPVLMDPAPESRLLQKKAYKLLYSMFEYRVKDVFPLFPRIIGLLSIGRQHVTTSGVKMRVRCLSWALDACKMFYPDDLVPTIRSLVGEIILFSRERSSDTRAMTMDVLEKMQRYMTSAGAPVNALLHMVVAGLSGKTAMMVSSAVVCMAKLVYLTHEELPTKDLEAAVALGFQLMDSTMMEVRSACAIFARMTLKLMKRSPRVGEAAKKAMPKILYAVALITSQPHVSSNTRVQMRVLLEKCIKRFGYEAIDPIFPLGSKNFLRYTHKMMRREEKKTEKEMQKRQERQQSEFDKFFLGTSMNAGGAEAAGEDLLEAGALTSFVSKHTAPMFPGMGGHSGDAADDDDEYDAMHLDFQDGKLRIISKDEKHKEDDHRRRQAMADRLLRKNHGLMTAESINDPVNRPGKRTRGGDEVEDFENAELVLRYGSRASDDAVNKATNAFSRTNAGAKVVAPSANQIAKLRDQKAATQALKRARVEEDIRKGEEFTGTGAGDVKRGNVEPFAYVPLNRRYMNKRHARQALHRFEVVNNKHLKGEKAKAMKERK